MTPEQFQQTLEQIKYHERKAEELRKLTRAYIYQQEAQRVKDKRTDSIRYYREENKSLIN